MSVETGGKRGALVRRVLIQLLTNAGILTAVGSLPVFGSCEWRVTLQSSASEAVACKTPSGWEVVPQGTALPPRTTAMLTASLSERLVEYGLMIPSKKGNGPPPSRTDFWTRRVSELHVAVGQADFEGALQQSPGPDALPAVVQALDRSTPLTPDQREAAVLAVLAYYGADRPDLVARAREGRYYVELERAWPSPRVYLLVGPAIGALCLWGAWLLRPRAGGGSGAVKRGMGDASVPSSP